jgi:predicted nucleotide-binding protein (sugar kinase/HSP70/actin superfamily)
MEYDYMKTLEECYPAVFNGFLEWRLVLGRIRKLSSITTYWKIHSLLYAEDVHEKMKDVVLLELRNVSCGAQACTRRC